MNTTEVWKECCVGKKHVIPQKTISVIVQKLLRKGFISVTGLGNCKKVRKNLQWLRVLVNSKTKDL